MKQNFLDGTPCQGGGKCANGVCTGGTVGKEIKDWIDRNKPLVIGLAVGIGSLLIILILGCCISSWRRRSRMRKAPPPPVSGWRPPGPVRGYSPGQGYARVPVPPQMAHRDGGYAHGAGGQQYDAGWNAPPPAYSGPPARYA